MASFAVTFAEITNYISKVKAAQEEYNAAKAGMKAAADELIGQISGDYADKFAAEQGVLDSNLAALDNLVTNAAGAAGQIAARYAEHEDAIHA